MGFPERFNRHYTDRSYTPTSTVYVSPAGGGDGSTMGSPTSVANGLSQAQPGTRVFFVPGQYSGCFELGDGEGGTYDDPVVLYAPLDAQGAPQVSIQCCATGRQTCINLEAANYVAVDGFELVGGRYGVRAVGADYAANQHQVGIAVLNSVGHDQDRDPFFTGQSDWYTIENVEAYNAGAGDGHGVYLSNGSDWMIVRNNELYNNMSADFQINADPASTCDDVGIPFSSPECDAYAGTHATGGRGASDYVLVENNFFHHGLSQGANFTSVRRSVVRNNIFAIYARHGVSFWQETDNPNLGSRENTVLHNLFVTTQTNRQSVQFINDSSQNTFANNVMAAVSLAGGNVSGNSGGLLMEVDATTANSNTYENNVYLSGTVSGRSPNASEHVETAVQASWFQAFPTALTHTAEALAPSATAPWLDTGTLQPSATADRLGNTRSVPTDPGPWELP